MSNLTQTNLKNNKNFKIRIYLLCSEIKKLHISQGITKNNKITKNNSENWRLRNKINVKQGEQYEVDIRDSYTEIVNKYEVNMRDSYTGVKSMRWITSQLYGMSR